MGCYGGYVVVVIGLWVVVVARLCQSGLLLRLGQLCLLLWVVMDGWDELWVVVVDGLWFVVTKGG